MRNPLFLAAIAILVTAMVVLMLAGGGRVAGIDGDVFASAAILSVWAMIIAAALLVRRGEARPRLWHAAVWLALFVTLMAGYRLYNAPQDETPVRIDTGGPSTSI